MCSCQIAVKPIGADCRDSMGISFNRKSNVSSICDAAVSLLNHMDERGIVSVEAVYESTNTRMKELDRGNLRSKKQDIHVQVLVCRGSDNKPHTTKVYSVNENVHVYTKIDNKLILY